MLRKRALVAGVAGAVPFPGLDWAVDAALLTQILSDAATTVLRITLDEYAVKQRKGGPLDDAGDMGHAVWTGELPFTHGRGAAIADALNTSDMPAYAAAWSTESA